MTSFIRLGGFSKLDRLPEVRRIETMAFYTNDSLETLASLQRIIPDALKRNISHDMPYRTSENKLSPLFPYFFLRAGRRDSSLVTNREKGDGNPGNVSMPSKWESTRRTDVFAIFFRRIIESINKNTNLIKISIIRRLY